MTNEQQTVIIDVVFRAASGQSILDKSVTQQDNLDVYAATKDTQEKAVSALQRLGFQIVGPASRYGVTIAGSRQLIKNVFGEDELTVPESLAAWIAAARIPPSGEFYT